MMGHQDLQASLDSKGHEDLKVCPGQPVSLNLHRKSVRKNNFSFKTKVN